MQPAPEKRRSPVGAFALVFKLGLTLGSLYVLYVSFWIIRTSLQSEPPSGYLPPSAAQAMWSAPPRTPRVRTPWPSYPGAKKIRKSHTVINGSPWVSERFEAAGTNSGILSFYRRHLRSEGWRDATEEQFGINPRFGAGGAPRNLQNQEFLIRYDKVVRSNLAMRRGQQFILAQVSEGSRSWKRRVSLRFMGVSPQAYSMDLATHMNSRPGFLVKPFLQAQREHAGENRDTEFFHSALPAHRLYQKLTRRMESEGWKKVKLPGDVGRTGVASGRIVCYEKRQDYALLQVQPLRDGNGSSGMLTKVGANW